MCVDVFCSGASVMDYRIDSYGIYVVLLNYYAQYVCSVWLASVVCVNVWSGKMSSLVNIQELSADKYDESLHKLIAKSTLLSSSKASACFLHQSMGFDIPLTKKYVTELQCVMYG